MGLENVNVKNDVTYCCTTYCNTHSTMYYNPLVTHFITTCVMSPAMHWA
jgi:hypothetical protein